MIQVWYFQSWKKEAKLLGSPWILAQHQCLLTAPFLFNVNPGLINPPLLRLLVNPCWLPKTGLTLHVFGTSSSSFSVVLWMLETDVPGISQPSAQRANQPWPLAAAGIAPWCR